jgi:hypothetical protein
MENPKTSTSNNQKIVSAATDKVELDHAIGFSGKMINSVFMHPNAKDYILISGCSVVVGDLSDPHN